jgi:hypothetical protein
MHSGTGTHEQPQPCTVQLTDAHGAVRTQTSSMTLMAENSQWRFAGTDLLK